MKNTKGFTLVEILVALMIFSLVVVVALAALVRIVDANRKAQTIQDAVINLSFTMESMTRELRTGSTYYCKVLAPGTDLSASSLVTQDVSGCVGTLGNASNGVGVGIAFLSNRTAPNGAGGTCHLINAYEITPNAPTGTFDGTFTFSKSSQPSCNANINTGFTPVVSTKSVTITSFYVQVNDDAYPLAFIKLEGNAGTKESGKTYFSLQTAATPRIP